MWLTKGERYEVENVFSISSEINIGVVYKLNKLQINTVFNIITARIKFDCLWSALS